MRDMAAICEDKGRIWSPAAEEVHQPRRKALGAAVLRHALRDLGVAMRSGEFASVSKRALSGEGGGCSRKRVSGAAVGVDQR
jgi:hypothetical protein